MAISKNKSSAAYTPLTLKLYDWWVLSISNNYAWRCPTDETLVHHFKKNLGFEHLDIGVGSGYYLSKIIDKRQITLMDLNSDSIRAACKRIGYDKLSMLIEHDVFNIFPSQCLNRYDSVSMFYLLHCLPGNMHLKSLAIQNAAMALKSDGVLFGATILGKGVQHNAFGRKLMKIYNRKGIFSNNGDCEQTLKNVLCSYFNMVDIKVIGTVALFKATEKKCS